MKLVNRTLALLLVFILLASSLTGITTVLAAEASTPNKTVLQNDFIKVTVDNGTGRFGIRTVEGQPIRKNDQNVNMLFRGDDPETSFTTFRIDGTDYIFGNPYKFAANFFSEITKPRIVVNSDGTQQIETVWKIKGVEIKQVLMLYLSSADKTRAGNVNVRYEVLNRSGAQVELGSRILLDTMVAGNDGPEFQIGTAYKVPLMVERKLVHNPEADPNISEEDRALYKLPPYWVMRDKLDLSNPLATNVVAYGFNNFAENNIHIVDEMIVGHWNGLANTKWDYTPNGNLDFTRDTNDFGTADSAVAFYWKPKPLANMAAQSFETVYGLGEIIEPDKAFSIRFMDTAQQLATLGDNSDYADEGVFDITAEVENLAMFNMEHTDITVQLSLESGLNFVKLDEAGKIVRDKNGKVATEAYRSKELQFIKPATPEEAAQGIKPKYKPGDTIVASFKVQAKGKPWPTTKEYLMTARSPETQGKVEGIEDESIKAQYESSKANFILLPPIGQAAATYAYGLSPKELFSSDVKYLTVNLTNIEAYTAGSANAEPNFDLFLKEKLTGKRYKVPVKESVILQPSDDGFSGDMRITYRGGALVDSAGNVLQGGLGADLPLGEYQVEIVFKGETGGDAEIAAMYNITTKQTFSVTDNPQSRIREAGLLAVYKQKVDLSHVTPSIGGNLLKEINEAFPGKPFASGTDLYSAVTVYKSAKQYVGAASKALDPKFKLNEFLSDDSLKEVPAYQYRLFDSQQEYDRFFDETDARGEPVREMLVNVRGMIKQVGTGTDQQVVVDTKTEPAIINDSVAYKGKDMVFVRGKLDIFNAASGVNGYNTMPFFDTLFVKGEGTLSVAGSGFIFHQGEWTLDFFNGFNKTLGEGYVIENQIFPDSEDNEEDDSLNGTLSWAVGALGDRLNPLRQLMLTHVYFNKQSLFAPPSFSISGFGFSFNDFILRQGGISFGGKLSMKIVDAEVRNVIFNSKGFVGVDAGLKFDLSKDLGLFEAKKKDGKKADKKGASGEINVVHYVQDVPDVSNRYGVKFKADIKALEVQAELSLKKVADGRILPDVIAFGTTLGKPGVLITGATYLTAVRGAVRELADTIAGGTSKDPFPLVVQAGVSMRFGIAPAYHFGDIDMTVKRTGIALQGKLDFSVKMDPDKKDLVPMISKALLEAQWVTPWFVRLQAEVDIGGWDVIVGKAGIFVGQNLEKNRTDFEGYLGAKLQIPSGVPVVGGLPLASVFFGINNDKIWGSVGILFISLGVTYYWGGGVEFGTSGEGLPEGFVHLLVEDPERGPQLLVIGQGMETIATSRIDTEQQTHEIVYRDVAEGVKILDNGSLNMGIGGINAKNGGRVHEIPLDAVTGNALIEIEYESKDMPAFTVKDAAGRSYPVVFDDNNTNPQANAFHQIVSSKDSSSKVDIKRAYVIVPQSQAKLGGKWTLTAVSPVETRLLNVPVGPELKSVSLAKNSSDANVFTAGWSVDNAKAGDTVNLYLTKDAVSTATTKLADGKEVLEPGEPGLLIAKNVPVAQGGDVTGVTSSGSYSIDVTRVPLLGDTEDIRGLLQQGSYYVRAELKSNAGFGTKTSVEKFDIVDPLAPAEVSEVDIKPAGNGYFALSFKPGAPRPGQEPFERSYRIEALQEAGGKLAAYPNFAEQLLTEAELAGHWNAASGKYEGIPVGGWTAMSTSDEINQGSLNGTTLDLKNVTYSGLKVGEEYVIGVTAATKPPKDADKHENVHYAGRIDSGKKLLPVPAKPKLKTDEAAAAVSIAAADGTSGFDQPAYIERLTNKTEQTIDVSSDQRNVVVEAFYAEQSLGSTALTNTANGSRGTLRFDRFKTDGPYAIELVSTNTDTGDVSVTMLYLTVDTSPPILYIDEPSTGVRSKNGLITVSGTTSNDAVLTVNGTRLTVADDGKFSGQVNVSGAEPAVTLAIVARDGAGNENRADVSVTSDSFRVPVALVFKSAKTLQPGEKAAIEPYLRVPDGKDGQGKPKFKEIAVPAEDRSRLSYEVTTGDAIRLEKDGTMTGLSVGSSLITARYAISDSVSLEGMLAASVETSKPAGLGAIDAYTAAVTGNTSRTKVVIRSAGDLTGRQLVYRVYPNRSEAVIPQWNQDISAWSFLPQNGEIAAKSGDTVIVATRASSTKRADAASGLLTAAIWSAASPGIGGGGGGGGGFPSAGKSGLTVNGQAVEAERKGDALTARIKAKDAAADAGSDIVVAMNDASVKNYTFRFEREIGQWAVRNKKHIVIELPTARLVITPDMLAGMKEELEVRVAPNGEAELAALKGIAGSVEAALLADGQGVTVETNVPEANWNSYLALRLPVPEGLQQGDITAVITANADGSWTPVPWRLDEGEGQAYVDVRLTGSGSVGLIRNTRTFGDVAADFWGKAVIDEASAKLFVQGKQPDRFDPESRITRAEYPTLLLRVAGWMSKTGTASFHDVSENDWFGRSVSVAARMGIVNGLEDGRFAPEATLSRLEAMTMAGRLLKALGIGEEIGEEEVERILDAYGDKEQIPDWGKIPVALSIKAGIIEGDNGLIRSADSLTRAQAAAIATRLDRYITGK
ncbi:S-layer homology domain-containing protein [Paenibacillus hodogayensis]|uniref:S-layer homology domain-containing protein n=1 Tax=Paenibacillus hodogayensis TaxID=279208 RepID=A0ABV5VTC2_9BACL